MSSPGQPRWRATIGGHTSPGVANTLLCVLVAAGSIATAQTKPDFTGRWALIETDDPAQDVARTLVIRAEFDGPSTVLTLERHLPSGVESERYTLGLIGGTTGGVSAVGEHNSRTTRFSVVWQGDTLVGNWRDYSEGSPERGPWHERVETWSLDDDAALVIVKTLRSSTESPRTLRYRYRRQASPPRGIAWFIFVDDLHLDFRNTGRIREALSTIGRVALSGADTYALRSSSQLKPPTGLTVDRELLWPAIKDIYGNGLRPDDIVATLPAPVARNEVRLRLNRTFLAGLEMLKEGQQAQAERTVVLYLSNGYVLDSTFDRDGYLEVVGEARRAAIRIFAISVLDLPDATIPNHGLDVATWERYRQDTRNSLRTLSADTNGVAFLGGEPLTEMLARVAQVVRQ